MPDESRFSRMRKLFRIDRGARAIEHAVDEELTFHFEMTVRDLIAGGMPPDDARRVAEQRFGDVPATRRRLTAIDRDREDAERRAEWWDGFRQDARYAIRMLRRSPGFAAAVIITLGLGIGANSAMFGIADRLLVRTPAFIIDPAHTQRVYLLRTYSGREIPNDHFQYRRYLDLAAWTHSFDRSAAFNERRAAIGTGSDTREMRVDAVSASFFRFFSARPVLGRFFTAADDSAPVGTPVVVLAWTFWSTHYGSRNVLGQQLQVGQTSYTIVGVAPRGFIGLSSDPPVVFVPITWYAQQFFETAVGAAASMRPGGETIYTTYSLSWMSMLTHRAPGVTEPAATTDLTAAFLRSYASQRAINPSVTPAEIAKPHAVIGSVLRERGPLQDANAKVAIWLSGVALVVLLVACANVANLLLARAFGRRREVAVRLALGVKRGRLVTQLLTESLVLAALGGVAGVAIGEWGGAVLRASFLPHAEWTGPATDHRTLLFTVAASLLAGLIAGLAPALHSGRASLIGSLKAGAREGTYHRSKTRIGLLVAQGALSVVLLVGAGLFVRSLEHVRAVPLGYDVDPLLWVEPNLRGTTLTNDQRAAMLERLRLRASGLPQVTGVARGLSVPFYSTWDFDLYVAGFDSVSRLGEFTLQAVSPEYFRTVGTRILRGRGITSADDRRGVAPSMVVSEAMAKVLWPNSDPIGKCVRVESDTAPCDYVVGVAEDIHDRGLTAKDDQLYHYYVATAQFKPEEGGLFVRTRGPTALQANAVAQVLNREMPGSSYVTATPMSDILGPVTQSWQLGAKLFVAFGALALVLAAIGLYSVIAYNAVQRSHEFGVRVALGAQRRDVATLMLGEGVRLGLTGVVIGAAIAVVGGRFLEPLLFQQSPDDPVVYGIVAATLLVSALAASIVPAIRATRVDPVVAMRVD